MRGNSLDKLRHPRSDAYSAEQVLLKQHVYGGAPKLDCYPSKGDQGLKELANVNLQMGRAQTNRQFY